VVSGAQSARGGAAGIIIGSAVGTNGVIVNDAVRRKNVRNGIGIRSRADKIGLVTLANYNNIKENKEVARALK